MLATKAATVCSAQFIFKGLWKDEWIQHDFMVWNTREAKSRVLHGQRPLSWWSRRVWLSGVSLLGVSNLILLIGHSIKFPSKYISLCPQINAALKPCQRSVFVQWMTISSETYNWSNGRVSVCGMPSHSGTSTCTSSLRGLLMEHPAGG